MPNAKSPPGLHCATGPSTLGKFQISILKFQRGALTALDNAILLAAQVHRGQKDKAGAPYILHPLRVMLRLKSEEEMLAAVLHDVVEDSACTLADLEHAGFPPQVIEAVDCLTRREGEAYEAFIERLKPNRLARRVKLADLEDNLDVRRLSQLGEKDLERLQTYLRAQASLTSEE
jgi:(p)ppGpp synthase/HD superfamily hydrolase